MTPRIGLALIAVFASAGAARVRADVKDFDWTLHGASGGGGALTPYTMTITGGNAGVAGGTEYRAVACVAGRVAFTGTYTSTDSGAFDYLYFKTGATQSIITTNAQQGVFTAEFAVAAGQTFAIGVHTTDGLGGAGKATITALTPVAQLDFSSFQAWALAQTPAGVNAAGVLPPPILKVIGGDSGVGGRAHVWSQTQMPMSVTAQGVYTSTDTGDFDSAYVYTQPASGPPAYETFATNATQGPFSKTFTVTGRHKLGLGVFTQDGEFGAGTLTASKFEVRAGPGHIPDFGWVLEDTAQGGGGILGEEMGIVGGDAGVAGYTEFNVQALFDFCVQAELEYFSEDIEDFDAAYYIVNGAATLVATNATQGLYRLSFAVEKGDVFGFGVATADGTFGPGEAIISKFRAIPVQPCYADCTGDRVLTAADFGCFQTRFVLGLALADCNADGALTVADFGCFQLKFVMKCE